MAEREEMTLWRLSYLNEAVTETGFRSESLQLRKIVRNPIGDAAYWLEPLRQFQAGCGAGGAVMQFNRRHDFRMHRGISDRTEKPAGGPRSRTTLVIFFPFLELSFGLCIRPGPAVRLAAQPTTPWFRREPRAKTFLRETELLVKRISAEGFKYLFGVQEHPAPRAPG